MEEAMSQFLGIKLYGTRIEPFENVELNLGMGLFENRDATYGPVLDVRTNARIEVTESQSIEVGKSREATKLEAIFKEEFDTHQPLIAINHLQSAVIFLIEVYHRNRTLNDKRFD